MANLSWSDSQTQVNGKTGFNLMGRGDKSGTQMVPKQIKALGLGCMVMAQGGNLASDLGNTPVFSIPGRRVCHYGMRSTESR
jgi:hypothetical protein